MCVVGASNETNSGPCDVGAWGSPLYEIQPEDGAILQVGLYSQGHCTSAPANADEALPHIYTRLAHYADWIQTQVCLYSYPITLECDLIVRRRRSLRGEVQ
jgi:secreted trypsin-like serine protease